MKRVKQFLDYAVSQEPAVVTYSASDMQLVIHFDASYLSKPESRSQAGEHHFLSNNDSNPPNNGAVLNISAIIQMVMSSAAETEIGALFINAKRAVPLRKTLEELGHPQTKPAIQTDSTTAAGLINNIITPKATKSITMNFHWLRCRTAQKQFRFYWGPGGANLADYFTKHFAAHHILYHPRIFTSKRYQEPQGLSALEMRTAMARVC